MSSYTFKNVFIRLISDDMSIPHVGCDIYTETMSGVKETFMNVRAYYRSSTDVAMAIVEVENFLLSMPNITIEAMSLDWQYSVSNPEFSTVVKSIMDKISLASRRKTAPVFEERESATRESATRIAGMQRQPHTQESMRVRPAEIIGTNTFDRFAQQKDGNGIYGKRFLETMKRFPENNTGTSHQFTLQKAENTTAARSGNGIHRFQETFPHDQELPDNLKTIANDLYDHVKTHSLNIPDFSVQHKKGIAKISNYIRSSLNVSITDNEARMLANEMIKLIARET